MTNNRPRTKAEAILSVKYQMRLHALHRRLYRRAQVLLSFISLAAGAAAIVPVWQTLPGGVAISGAIIALISLVGALGGFAEDSVRHDLWRRDAAELLARTGDMELPAIDAALARFPGDDEIIESLRAVAFNDVLCSSGFEDGMRPERFGQRFFRLIA